QRNNSQLGVAVPRPDGSGRPPPAEPRRVIQRRTGYSHNAQRRQTPALCSSRAELLLAHALNGNDQVDSLGRRTEIHLDVEIFQLERGSALEACTVATPGILAFAYELGRDNDRLGDTIESQVALDISGILARALDRSGHEGRGGVLAVIQKVVATQVLVALGMVGIEACRLERHLDLAGFWLRRVEAEASFEVFEGTPQPAITQVAGLEVDEGM